MSVDRDTTMLWNEGQVLQLAGNAGKAHAAEYARAAIDGFVNAMVRLEGPEQAAAFAFALADRVVGRVKAPTAWPLHAAIEPAPEPVVVIPPSPPKPPPRRYGYWTIFTIGWCCGVAAGAALAWGMLR